MLGTRGSRTPNPVKKPADSDRRLDTVKDRLRRLRRAAVFSTIAATSLSILPIVNGFGLPGFLGVVVLAWFVVSNFLTVSLMKRQAPTLRIPAFRIVMTTIGAFVVALTVPLWSFDSDIRAIQASRDPLVWDEKAHPLEVQRGSDLDALGKQPPEVESDSEVIRLEGLLDKANDQLIDAKKAVICEQDGTCGTRVPGKAEAYDDKLKFQHQLEHDVAVRTKQLAEAKADVTRRADDLRIRQDQARQELPVIDAKLTKLGPRPSPPNRFAALWNIAISQKVKAVIVALAGLLSSVLVDLLAFLVVMRISRNRKNDGPDTSFRSLVESQSKKDERARRATSVQDLSPKMRDTYDIPPRQVNGDDPR